MRTESRSVLLLGGQRSGLSAARDLHSGGWEVGVGVADPADDFASASWRIHRRHAIPPPSENLDAFAEATVRAVEERGYGVVLASDDEYLAGLSAVRERIAAAVPYAPHKTVLRVLDKMAIEEEAYRVGLRTPETKVATDDAIDSWPGPAVVKDRTHWNPGQPVRGRGEALLALDADAMRTHVARLRAAGGEPILQVPATGRMLCYGAFRTPDGRIRGRIQQTSDHLWPVPLGTTARAVTIPIDPDLSERCNALLEALGWVGMANFQVFRQPDHAYTVIDFNPRFNYSMALALAAGIRFASAWASMALGLPLPDLPDARPGVRFSVLSGDVKRALRERRGGLVRDLTGTVLHAAIAHHTIFTVRDLGPTVFWVRRGMSRVFSAGWNGSSRDSEKPGKGGVNGTPPFGITGGERSADDRSRRQVP